MRRISAHKRVSALGRLGVTTRSGAAAARTSRRANGLPGYLTDSILEQTAEAVVVCDRQGRVLLANRSAYRLCGRDPARRRLTDVLPLRHGRSPRPWHLPERRQYPRLGPPVSPSDLCDGLAVHNMQVNLPRTEGQYLNLLLSAGPLLDDRRRPAGCVLTLVDVTEQTRAQDAYRESESRLARLADSNIVGFISATEETILAANDAFLDMIGRSRQDLRTGELCWLDWISPEHRPAAQRMLQELRTTGRSVPHEQVFLRSDGTALPVLMGAVLGEALPLRWEGIVVDLAPRKNAEEALRLSEDRFAKAFEATPEGVSISRVADGRIIEVNAGWERLCGHPRDQAIGRSTLDLGLYLDASDRTRLLEQLDARGAVRDFEMRIRRRSGEVRVVSLSVERIAAGSEDCLLSILHDITTQKEAEKALRDSEEKLQVRVHERTAELADINRALGAEIAERERTEQALRQSRAEFQVLLESAPDAIVSADGDGRIVLVNHQTEKMFGYARDELLGRPVEILLPARLSSLHARHRNDYAVNPTTRPMGVGLDLAGRRKDGTEFPVEISLSPVPLAESMFVTSIIRDVTERRRVTQALALQAQRLQEQASLIELAHVTIIVRDMDNRIVFWNHGAEETYGWAKDQALGRVTQELLETQFPESHDQVHATLLAQGQWEGEVVHRTRDGRRVVVASRQVLQRDEHRQPRVILEINRDITQRRIAEVKLSESEARFRTLVEQVEDYAIFGVDREGQITSWNVGAERVYGYRSEQIVGKRVSRFHLPQDVDGGKLEIELRVAAAEGTYREVGPHLRQDGSVFFADVLLTALRDPSGDLVGYAAVTRDITARKEAEEKIQKLNRELAQRVNELATVNHELESFSYSVSHDLRAPLRAIAGFSQALAEDYNDVLDASGKDYTRRIHAATQRLTQLIDDLLTLSRVTRTEMAPDSAVDLSALVRSIAAQLQAANSDRKVTLTVAPDQVTHGDPRLIRIALENLIGNAWKFTSKVAAAEIEFGRDGTEDGRIIYLIRDNGAGFDMAYSEKLFGPFQRLHAATEFPGTGIGLATVQRIIRRHGGRVWATGAVNQGATFYFTL